MSNVRFPSGVKNLTLSIASIEALRSVQPLSYGRTYGLHSLVTKDLECEIGHSLASGAEIKYANLHSFLPLHGGYLKRRESMLFLPSNFQPLKI